MGLLLLILVSLFLLLSSLYAAEASVFKKAREAALDAASPVLAVFAGPAAFLQNRIGEVRNYFSVLEQNRALREEISALRHWEREARELRKVIASIEALDGYNTPPRAKPVVGFVVGETNDAYARSMIVNAGRGDRIGVGQAVVDERGLVGRIVEVGGGASRVLLLTDVQSRVPVFIEEAEVEGILVGRTNGRPAIAFTRFDDLARVRAGQRVATSGAGGVVPRGLPVGVVAETGDEEARIALDANYALTRVVRVLNHRFPGVDDSLPEDALSSPDVDPSEIATDPATSAGERLAETEPGD